MNLYIKIALLTLGLVFFTGTTVVIFVSIDTEKSLREEVLTKFDKYANLAINNIDRYVFERIKDMENLSIWLASIVPSPQADLSQADMLLKKYQKDNPFFESLSYFDLDRVRLLDTKNASVGKVHSLKRYWYEIAQGNQTRIIDISRSESLNRTVMHVAVPVKNAKNQTNAWLVGRILIEELYEVFEQIGKQEPKLKEHIGIELTDSAGLLIYSNRQPEQVLTQTFEKIEQVKKARLVQEHFSQGEVIYFYTSSQGYQDYDGKGWHFILSLPEQVLLSSVKALRIKLYWTVFGVSLVALLLGLLFARFLAKPLKQLTKAVDSFGQDNRPIELKITSKDEIGVLGKHFSRMAAHLHSKITEQSQLNEELSSAFEQIERKNKDITASITYAERIQRAILPTIAELSSHFEDAFVFYKPRDIVSGDFYWYDRILSQGKYYDVLVVADCTGHGVPGGFLSVLGTNLLSQIISSNKLLAPNLILKQLNQEIKRALHQDLGAGWESTQDGMEIGICVFDVDAQKLDFAGCGCPMYLYRNEALIEYQAAKIHIGGVARSPKSFTSFEQMPSYQLDLQKNDRIFLCSDGYKDQIGGLENKKFSRKRFKDLLLASCQMPLKDQYVHLVETHKNWLGEYKQTDDILVVGVQI